MSRKPVLPYDIRQECIWIVRRYDRRVKAYHEARRGIIDGAACGFVDTKAAKGKPSVRVFLPHGTGDSRQAENKMEQLDAIEDWPETQRMRAVENAELHIGLDLVNEELRQRLTEGILLNCKDRREYPLRYMNLPGISEVDFRRRKDGFLSEIAKFLLLI
ncbi:hypothetical protein OBV_18010 [Oscillibacter valericigenes Sjm18-20]|nr:hypothetical protein OBV_18010 [Oscillibacter valericigenes Sjm18-20]